MTRLSYFQLIAAVLLTTGMNARAATPTMSATPASITFGYQSGAASVPKAQKVAVKASTGTPAFATSISGANPFWLNVSLDSGTLPANLSVFVNPTTLAVGQYTATIAVAAAGITLPLNVVVTLNVTAASTALMLSSTSMAFIAPPSPVASQTVQLSTNGTPISFTAASGSAWMTVSPAVGVVLPGEQVSLTVTVDPTALVPQITAYTGKITIVQVNGGSSAKSQNIVVTLTVNSATPTIVSIWPPTLPVNAGAQTISIRGTNFYSGTTAMIQGVTTALVTSVISPSALQAVVPAAQLTLAATLNIVAVNPSPGGSSGPLALTVANVPSIQTVGNVASYGALAISPGELITIFGTNIGPTTPASMTITAGVADTTLGGVTLMIDGQAAPLLYVSFNQVTAQVPYEVTVGAGKTVTLTNGSNPAATSTVMISAAAPGLFTSDGTGTGEAAALNYNSTTAVYTLNTSANPAHLGDTILLYLTGEGDYNPTISPRTGLIIPPTMSPLPEVSPYPTVTIGGAPVVTVAYAGPVPGSILGLLQINCVVPAASKTGTAVPVAVSFGGVSTQIGVTLSIHQ